MGSFYLQMTSKLRIYYSPFNLWESYREVPFIAHWI